LDLVLIDGLLDGLLDDFGVCRVTEMLEHVKGGAQHGHRVGDVLAGDGGAGVPGAGLENGVLMQKN
jgi:hypothetical protein